MVKIMKKIAFVTKQKRGGNTATLNSRLVRKLEQAKCTNP